MNYKIVKGKIMFILIIFTVIILIVLWVLFGRKPIYHSYNVTVYNNNDNEVIDECKVIINGYTDDFVLPNNTDNIAHFIGSIKFSDIKLDRCDFFILNNNWMKIVQSIPEGSIIHHKEIGEIYIEDNFKNIKLLIKKNITYKNVDYNALRIESIKP